MFNYHDPLDGMSSIVLFSFLFLIFLLLMKLFKIKFQRYYKLLIWYLNLLLINNITKSLKYEI